MYFACLTWCFMCREAHVIRTSNVCMTGAHVHIYCTTYSIYYLVRTVESVWGNHTWDWKMDCFREKACYSGWIVHYRPLRDLVPWLLWRWPVHTVTVIHWPDYIHSTHCWCSISLNCAMCVVLCMCCEYSDCTSRMHVALLFTVTYSSIY